MNKRNLFRLVVTLCGAATAVGCASVRDELHVPSDRLVRLVPAGAVTPGPRAALAYRVLAAELALRRGQAEQSLALYREALAQTEDAGLAERVAGVALHLGDAEVMLQAARRWVDLQPADPRARQALAVALVRNDVGDEIGAALERVRADAIGDGQDGFATVNALLGQQLDDKGRIYELIQPLQAEHPQSVAGLYFLALAALDADAHAEAAQALEQALRRSPRGGAPLHLLKARVLVEQGYPQAALRGLASAVGAAPADQALRTGYARLLVGTGRQDEARRQFAVLARQRADDPEPRFALGVLAQEAGDDVEAERWFRDVVKLQGRSMDAYFELGRIEARRGRHERAVEWFRRVTAGERVLSAQIQIGALLAAEGDVAGALAHFEDLRRANPHAAASLYLGQAEVLRDARRFREAFDLLSQALMEMPGQAELLYARALSAERIDRLDILEQDLLKVLEQDPDHGYALNALGYTLADRTERHREALRYIQRALVLLPEDPAVMDSMGWALYRLGRLPEALDWLRRAYGRLPDGEIAAHLSEVLWRSGLQDEARRVFREALRAQPDSTHLQQLKQRFDW